MRQRKDRLGRERIGMLGGGMDGKVIGKGLDRNGGLGLLDCDDDGQKIDQISD